MRYIYIILCHFLLLLSGPSQAALGLVEPGNEAPVVVAVGDSLFTGYGVRDHSSVPQMIGYQLIARNYQVSVKNLSYRSQTITKALERVDTVIRDYKPKVAIICLGLEDVKKEEKLATIYKNLGELIKAYRKADVRVVLVGFDLPSDVPAVYKTAAYQKKFKQIYKKIAQQYQIPFYPNLFNNLDDIPFYRSVDKYHLNKKGVRYVSEKLYSTVGLLLQ